MGGMCSSCESTNVVTAKLILQDGRLQEYSYPVKVSYVLQKNPACFICNSDEMDFDDVVSAVSDEEELQLGQLYFALPLSRLRQRLQAEEMAALAVKASSALTKSGGGEKCGCSRKNSLQFSYVVDVNNNPSSKAGDVEDVGLRRKRNGGGRRGRKYTAKLSAIPE